MQDSLIDAFIVTVVLTEKAQYSMWSQHEKGLLAVEAPQTVAS